MLFRTPQPFLFSVLFTAVCAVTTFAQSLKHERYELKNGLTVILHEDHSLPIAGVNLWYRVGARDEPPGRSGFAHLFEHLMFMGTRRVPGSDFDNLMENGGGSNNASTSLDRTNYFSSGPSSILPLLLWLDADRLEDLGVNMTKEKLDLQRDVVRNELRQVVENTPYARAYEATYQLLYPAGHPYHNGVIGTHQDLEAANVDDVKNFFASFYAPSNCAIVVAGDFDPAKIKPLVEEHFGSIPRGNTSPQRAATAPKLDSVLRTSMIDKVQLPKLAMSYHSPANYAPGDAEMNLVGLLLADGKNSRLYKRLVVQDQTAASVTAAQDAAALGSVFRIEVLAKPDADLSAIEKVVDEEIAKFIAEGPTAAELAQRAATIEMGMLTALQSVMARADKLNEYFYAWGEPDSLQRDLDRYRKATPDAVKRWAREVLTPNARLIQRVLPEEPVRPESGPREKRPADFASTNFVPPLPQTIKLANGMPVYVWSRSDLPLIACQVLIDPGHPVDDAGKAGLTSLLATMTQEGAGDRDGAAFAEALQALGASMNAGADYESLSVSLQVLARNFEPAAALLADALMRPRLDAKDWERVKALHIDDLKQQDEEPQAVAPRVASRLLLSPGNPLAWPIDGTVDTVQTLSHDDVQKARGYLLRDGFAKVLIAGDISPEAAKSVLDKTLGTWNVKSSTAHGPTDSSFAPVPDGQNGPRVFIVNRPAAVQTVLHFAAPGPKFADAERVDMELANIILGGSFTSRLNRNLREVHGYTYGARSRIGPRERLGTFRASTAVRAEVTGPALKELLGELTRIASGDVSAEELQKARETFKNDSAQTYATLGGIVGENANLIINRGGFDSVKADLSRAGEATTASLNAAASKTVRLNRGVLVLVGDKELILEQIKDLGLGTAVEVDAQGRAK